MVKDKRYNIVKNLIITGYIKSFRTIFEVIPKSVVARDLGMNNTRFSALMERMDKFLLKDLFILAGFLEVEESVLVDLVIEQYLLDKESKKVLRNKSPKKDTESH